jgi:hypothetical protein
MDPGLLQGLTSPAAVPDDQITNAPYRMAIGQLLYLTMKTRRDIAVAVGILSRNVASPTELHWAAVKRLLRYLKGTQDYGIHISSQSDTLVVHADADWGGESDRKSVSGFVITIGCVPISWRSRKQTAIALSITEAEYAILSEASREVTWIRKFCECLGHKQRKPTLIPQDNVGSIGWANGIGKFARSKHIDLRMHHIQTLVQDKVIAPVQVPTGAMEARIMTKPLAVNHAICSE